MLLKIFNILVLIGSFAIITLLSIEAIISESIVSETFVLRFQAIVCAIFFMDYVVRFFESDRKLHFIATNILFLAVSIPYINIVHAMNISLTPLEHMLVRMMPLIRGGYGIIIMISWLTRSKIATLFASYIATIFATTYFASLLFYEVEKGVNSMVTNYWDSLWWACMDVTTVGSNIYAVTRTGQVLSVLLAASGMMMFPIFTAYITSRFQSQRAEDNLHNQPPPPEKP